MIYKIFSDLHFGQTSEILTQIYPMQGDVFLGDIFDLKNTSKKKIATQLIKYENFKKDCELVGAHYITGNHEVDKIAPLHKKINNVLFVHGHYICWDQATIDKWENKEPVGVGKFREFILEIQNLYKRGVWKPSNLEIARAVKLAKDHNCDTIVLGHTHTKERVDFKSNDIRIINVPRGMSVIEA